MMKKRVGAPLKTPASKRQAVGSSKKSIMNLKETKRRVVTRENTPFTGMLAGGEYIDITQWATAGYDDLAADRGYLKGCRIKGIFSSGAVGNYVRVMLIKSKRAENLSSASYIFLDPAVAVGTPGRPSTEILLSDQIVAPVNRDGFVVKYDETFFIEPTAGGAQGVHFDKYVSLNNEKFDLERAGISLSNAHYYVVMFSCEADNTASSVYFNVMAETLFKDGI